jgi:hypothetical protein
MSSESLVISKISQYSRTTQIISHSLSCPISLALRRAKYEIKHDMYTQTIETNTRSMMSMHLLVYTLNGSTDTTVPSTGGDSDDGGDLTPPVDGGGDPTPPVGGGDSTNAWTETVIFKPCMQWL